MRLQKCCFNPLNSLNFLVLSSCKLSHTKNVIKFYSWISIIVKHWNIVQLTSHNILGLVALILVVPISTNCSLIKGIKILIGELKFDYDISSQSSYLILDLDPNACNVFRFGLVSYENLQRSWILETHCSATHFEKWVLKFGAWNWNLNLNF